MTEWDSASDEKTKWKPCVAAMWRDKVPSLLKDHKNQAKQLFTSNVDVYFEWTNWEIKLKTIYLSMNL